MIDEDAIRMSVLADNLDEVDYYALLEISRDATPEDVRDGFHRFALRFHPDQHVGDAAKQKQALRIFKRGAEAYRVLMHTVLRSRYDDCLSKGKVRLPVDQMQPPAEGSAPGEIPANARAFFEKAVALLEKGDLGGARMHLMLAAARGESPEFDRLAARISEAEKRRGGKR